MYIRASQWWDLAPRGFEHISPLQFKAMQGIVSACIILYISACIILYSS